MNDSHREYKLIWFLSWNTTGNSDVEFFDIGFYLREVSNTQYIDEARLL